MSLTLQHSIKYLRREKVPMQTAPTTIHCKMQLQLLTSSKAGDRLASGIGVWCESKPNQRCLSPVHPNKVQIQKASNPLSLLICLCCAAPPPHLPTVARMHKRSRFPPLASLPFSSLCFFDSLALSLHHVHGVLGKKGVDVGEGRAELAVSVPATQHELIEALRTHSWFAQIHLGDRDREGERCIKVAPFE